MQTSYRKLQHARSQSHTGSRPLHRNIVAARDPPTPPARPRGFSARVFSVQLLMLPALIGYGLAATPLDDGGALPCLWRLWSGFRCPGCGLSRANALLIEGSIREALAMNWLIIPLWMVAVWSFVTALPTILPEGVSWLNLARWNSPSS